MSAASDDIDLPNRHASFTGDKALGSASLPLGSIDEGPSRRRLHPYHAFLEEAFDRSDSGYLNVLRFYQRIETAGASSLDLRPHSIASECFDFCTSFIDRPASLRTTVFQGPIKDYVSGRPPVSGMIRVIIMQLDEILSYQELVRLMDDIGVYFKLPPSFFTPFIVPYNVTASFRRPVAAHDAYAYTEALVFTVGIEPVVVQPVAFPGVEAADMTLVLVLSRASLSSTLLRSLATCEADIRARSKNVICAIARLWVQKLQRRLTDAGYFYERNSDAVEYSRKVFETMADLEKGSSTLDRWFLIKCLCETNLSPCGQYLVYRLEHQRVLDETRRISQQMQLRASLLSIEESKRGIQQSKQVGRLTQLAFVFIPLTFVTGVFGMNITQFGGEAPLWKFWVTAGTISGVAFVIGSMTTWTEMWIRIKVGLLVLRFKIEDGWLYLKRLRRSRD